VPSTGATDGAFTWVDFVDRDQRDVLTEVRRLSARPQLHVSWRRGWLGADHGRDR
jgi:hypothetical protein